MDIHYVVPLDTDPPTWVQRAWVNRGLDPKTGRTPGAPPSVAAQVAVTLAVLAGIGVFFWLCVSIFITLATS